MAAAADRFENPSLVEPGSFAAAFGSKSTMDDDGFIVMDYSGSAEVAATTPIAAENVRAPSLGLGSGVFSSPPRAPPASRGGGSVAADGSAPRGRRSPPPTSPPPDPSSRWTTRTTRSRPRPRLARSPRVAVPRRRSSFARRLSPRNFGRGFLRRRARHAHDRHRGRLRASVRARRASRVRDDSRSARVSPRRRPPALRRSSPPPAPAADVARFDLASGANSASCSPPPPPPRGRRRLRRRPSRLSCVTAGAVGSGLVAAAGEGGDVHLWDVRVAPRGSRKSLGAGARASGGRARPDVARRGAARVLSLSLQKARALTNSPSSLLTARASSIFARRNDRRV